MPEPFKNVFSVAVIEQMAFCFKQADATFAYSDFINAASHDLDNLELKQRSEQIVEAMQRFLPVDFVQSSKILLASLKPMQDHDVPSEATEHAWQLSGWPIMPLADYVARNGHSDFDLSMRLLYEMTQRFTAEFAIRYFIIACPEQTLAYLHQCTKDKSEHVRRLVSEGTRPRLPWGIQLKDFVDNPSALLPLLEALKDDPSEYVRRSVANNLNDIAKDHPDIVVNVCKAWLKGASKERIRLIKHACRTLFKQGMPEALALLGFHPVKVGDLELTLSAQELAFDNSLQISVAFTSHAKLRQKIMLDYVVHHKKANGKLLPKVFKWKNFELEAGKRIVFNKKHSFKPISTRKYYAGEHRISILLNGKEFGMEVFNLVM
jgi:3-methyladenine DNA glycosylase AlkC